MKHIIADVVAEAARTLGLDPVPEFSIEQPKDPSHGDISTNVAFLAAKAVKANPRQAAERFVALFAERGDLFSSVEIAGPGFINFRIAPDFLAAQLGAAAEAGQGYGRVDIGGGRTVNVEYVSANPTGLLHLGHGRNAAIGDTVANIYEWNGWVVTREYYFNNAGNQMNMLAKSIHARYCQAIKGEEYPFPEDGYHGEYIKTIAAEFRQVHGDGYLDFSDDNVAKFRVAGEQWCFAAIRRTIERMGIHPDVYFNEDTLYQDGSIESVVDRLRSKGLVYEKDGATWLKLSELGLENDRVIIKSTGEPTYRLPDIAYHVNKFERGFATVVDIFGADHIATIPDVKAACGALGYDIAKLEVLIYQFVTLTENGETVKMSKRTGKSYTLDELIEEVGADVVRFFFVMRGIGTHLEFDLALAKEQSEKNPVFYLQYAHARIASILRMAEEKGIAVVATPRWVALEHTSELDLAKDLLRFPDVVKRAGVTLEPQVIAEYLREIAAGFHKFYHDCSIIHAQSDDLRDARLALAVVAKTVLRNGLAILGISAPEKM